MARLFDVLMLFLSLVGLSVATDFVSSGWSPLGMGGASYQTLSYTSALAFGLNVHLLNAGGPLQRYRFARSRPYRLLCWALLPLQALSVAISGGRGGAVLIIVYIVQLLFEKSTSVSRGRRVVMAVVVVCLLWLAVQIGLPYTAVSAGYDRLFSYVSSSGIVWTGTSNRDVVYPQAMALIAKRPGLGYGPFGYMNLIAPFVYPHNLFLELALDGGVIGLIFGISVFGWLYRRYSRLREGCPCYGLIGVLATYQLVLLMFSGTYLVAPTLWFVGGILLASSPPGMRPGVHVGRNLSYRIRQGWQ